MRLVKLTMTALGLLVLLGVVVYAQLNISGNPPLPIANGGTNSTTGDLAATNFISTGKIKSDTNPITFRNAADTAYQNIWVKSININDVSQKQLLYTNSSSTVLADANLTWDSTTGLNSGKAITGLLYQTVTNCADSAGAAACGAAPAGAFVIDAAATSVVVSTTAVTANSEIHVTEDSSLNTRLGITCNTQSVLVIGSPVVTARTAATSFTVSVVVAPTATPTCYNYSIVN